MSSTQQINYRADIDGLRAVAVLAVVLNHLSSGWLSGGYVGVDVFFVISGYLITGIINREIAEGKFTFSGFYERRARRIFPALFAMLTVTLVASYLLLLPSDMVSTLKGALGTLFFASNIVFWREMAEGYFAATDLGLNPLLHTWSLAVEEQFYVLFPVLLLACHRYAKRLIVPVLLICAAGSLAAAAFLIQSKSVAVFFLSPFRAWELLIGSLLALNAIPPIKSRLAREVAAGVGLIAILWACFSYSKGTVFPGLAALAPVLGAAAIIHAGSSGSSLTKKLLELPPIVFIGLISYSLYLWHWPLIVLTRYANGMDPITDQLPRLFAASILAAWLSYRYIEQPFRHKKIISKKVVFGASAVFMSSMAIASSIGLINNGFENRFSAESIAYDKARHARIPLEHCDGRPSNSWCIIGDKNVKPSIILWGDSHMLAWSPGIDKVLRNQGKSAFLAIQTSCWPLIEKIQNKEKCTRSRTNLVEFLSNDNQIKIIVISSYWPITPTKEQNFIYSNNIYNKSFEKAFKTTLDWLRKIDKTVMLLGPIPTYDNSIPYLLAVSDNQHKKAPIKTSNEIIKRHQEFFETVRTYNKTANIKFLNPVDWLCQPECILSINGTSLYRDSNHLSIEGALALITHIENVLNNIDNEK